MNNYIIHKAGSRGNADHGWLLSRHTFSFASYYNPERIRFGALRVLNDDTVQPGMGFSTHPHDNMEIISIPLEGDLEHRDSMGNGSVIKYGDIQVMSAGTGVFHSEFNHSKINPVKFLQIWVFPNKKNVEPRYDQITLNTGERKNRLQQILSPYPDDEGVWIHQDAWFYLADFDDNITADYTLKKKDNGVYFFVIKGKIIINNIELSERDGIGFRETETFELKSLGSSELLVMEVPMTI